MERRENGENRKHSRMYTCSGWVELEGKLHVFMFKYSKKEENIIWGSTQTTLINKFSIKFSLLLFLREKPECLRVHQHYFDNLNGRLSITHRIFCFLTAQYRGSNASVLVRYAKVFSTSSMFSPTQTFRFLQHQRLIKYLSVHNIKQLLIAQLKSFKFREISFNNLAIFHFNGVGEGSAGGGKQIFCLHRIKHNVVFNWINFIFFMSLDFERRFIEVVKATSFVSVSSFPFQQTLIQTEGSRT